MKKVTKLFAVSILTTLMACGGGGGGSPDYTGAGNVTLRVSQEQIDTGDRTKVTVSFDELHPDGVILKLRYASGLEYIGDTSLWKVGGKNIDASPDYELAADIAQETYLVYELSRETLGNNNSGELVFELRGIEETSQNSVIEVDLDVLEEGAIFTSDSPEFSTEYSTNLRVK